MNESLDNKIYNNVHWHVERHSMDSDSWLFTRITNHHDPALCEIDTSSGERAVVTARTTEFNWYALTTRRITGTFNGVDFNVPANRITQCNFGQNPKGYGGVQLAIALVTDADGNSIEFEFETGRAWMAPEYYTSWWVRKCAILNILKFDPKPEAMA